MVNADSTQLLTILKNLQNSISSIETTKNSVKLKYQQLGNEWNDKKYYELGNIVKDCNKALNDLLQIMLQTEKYVASLAKSIQEYDNVSLDTNSAHNSFVQSLRVPNTGNSSYEYCLELDNEYYEIEKQYIQHFGHSVPREMLPDSISMEQIKQVMKKCILSETDNLFELLRVTINDDYLY